MSHNQPSRPPTDGFGRRIEYLRLSVTDRCNLRCFYCLPEGCTDFAARKDYLSGDEIERLIDAFVAVGLKRLRITGGEPLVRKDLNRLIKRLSGKAELTDLSLSTNAMLLHDRAQALRDAGVQRLNVSLDSLDPQRFSQITGGGDLGAVRQGLAAAQRAGFAPIKINMLALAGINDDEIEGMFEFCRDNGFTLRLIEVMPMGVTGRWSRRHFLDLQTVKARLMQSYDLEPSKMPGGGPARYFQIRNTTDKIGFITPMSEHFCATCNRVRLAADGRLHLCLGQNAGLDFKPLLRQGASIGQLQRALCEALRQKPERHEFLEKPDQINRFMAATGG